MKSYINSVLPKKVSDLTDDSGHYTKPSGGIPASDLADGVVPVEDVQVNGTSIVEDGVANVPVASGNNFGVVKVANGLRIDTGRLVINRAAIDQIKEGVNGYVPIVPYNQHESTFYGLAKAAGDTTQSSSSNAVGNYTDSAKTAIKNMLGVPEDPLAVGTALPASADLNSYTTPGNYTADSTVIASITHAPTTTVEYKLTVEQISDDVIKQTITTTETPANVYQRTGDSSSTNWVFGDWVKEIKSTDYATAGTGGQSGQPGIVKIGDGTVGIGLASNGELRTISASAGLIKAGTSDNRQISPMRQHESTFYGLAKAAGDTTQSVSDNTVGVYTDDAKSAIQNMLGISDGYVTKESIDNAGITDRTYAPLFGGQFSVTTATTENYINPYARATVTGRISKHYTYRVTVNET